MRSGETKEQPESVPVESAFHVRKSFGAYDGEKEVQDNLHRAECVERMVVSESPMVTGWPVG